jgi:hypothetical protein
MPKKNKTPSSIMLSSRAQRFRQQVEQVEKRLAQLDPDFDSLRKLSPGEHSPTRTLFTAGWLSSDFVPLPPDGEKFIIEGWLFVLEMAAHETLEKNLPPGISKDLQEVSEDELFKRRMFNGQRRCLNNVQAGALAVIAHAAELKEFLGLREMVSSQPLIDAARKFFAVELVTGKDGRWTKYRPPLERLSRKERERRAALKGMRIAMAAIRLDLRENLWPCIKHGAQFRNGSKKNRVNNLRRDIESALQVKGRTVSPAEVWADFELKAESNDKVVIKVLDETMQYRRRPGGPIRTIVKKTFENMVRDCRLKLTKSV